MDKVTRFDKPTMSRLANDVEVAVQSVAEKYGITIVGGGGSFQDLQATLRLRLKAVGKDGESQEAIDYKEACQLLGMKLEWLGREVIGSDGTRYRLIGYQPRRRTRPIVMERVKDGKRFIFAEAMIRALFKRQETATQTA